MPKEVLNPDGLFKPEAYSQVVRAGNLVFLAGQTPRDVTGAVVGKGDTEVQAVQVFENIRNMEDIVHMRTYLTDGVNREVLGQVRRCYFNGPPPPSTLLIVKGLANPDYLLEIEVVAVLD
jgi:2-iminobutanoate/2-iminopropanoate deaminase